MNQQPPARSPAPPVSQWIKRTKVRCIKDVPFGPDRNIFGLLFAAGDETEVVELHGSMIAIQATRGIKGYVEMPIADAAEWFEFVSLPATPEPAKAKSIPEIIAEWRKGCGNTWVDREHPSACAQCTDNMVEAVLQRHEQDLKAAAPVANAEEVARKICLNISYGNLDDADTLRSFVEGGFTGDSELGQLIKDLSKVRYSSARHAMTGEHPESFTPFRPVVLCAPGYERLTAVLKAAHDQATYGKGADRHANNLPFHEQRMQQISQLFDSPLGMAYQVAKKVAEGITLPTHDRQVAELLGAINYIAGIVIFLEDKQAKGGEIDPDKEKLADHIRTTTGLQ